VLRYTIHSFEFVLVLGGTKFFENVYVRAKIAWFITEDSLKNSLRAVHDLFFCGMRS
jgi:hypothetical protein